MYFHNSSKIMMIRSTLLLTLFLLFLGAGESRLEYGRVLKGSKSEREKTKNGSRTVVRPHDCLPDLVISTTEMNCIYSVCDDNDRRLRRLEEETHPDGECHAELVVSLPDTSEGSCRYCLDQE